VKSLKPSEAGREIIAAGLFRDLPPESVKRTRDVKVVRSINALPGCQPSMVRVWIGLRPSNVGLSICCGKTG
jgi:hypothetical protein